MNRDKRKPVGAEVPRDVKEALDAADDPQWRAITKAVRAYYGLNDAEEVLKQRLDDLRKQRTSLAEQVDEIHNEMDEIDNEIEAIKQKLEEERAADQAYQERIEEIAQSMAAEGCNIVAFEDEVRELCVEQYGEATEQHRREVTEDIRNVADEHDLGIPDPKLSWSSSPAAATDGRGTDESIAEKYGLNQSPRQGGDAYDF